MMATTPDNGSSIGDLLKQLIEDVGHLFRTELRLAVAEVRGNIAGLKTGVVAIAIGGSLMLVAMFTLVSALVLWVTPIVGSAALAALLVAVGLLVVGGISIAVGTSKLKASSLTPDRAIASLRQDAQTLKGN